MNSPANNGKTFVLRYEFWGKTPDLGPDSTVNPSPSVEYAEIQAANYDEAISKAVNRLPQTRVISCLIFERGKTKPRLHSFAGNHTTVLPPVILATEQEKLSDIIARQTKTIKVRT